jgi:hypothetical protein
LLPCAEAPLAADAAYSARTATVIPANRPAAWIAEIRQHGRM